jgi:hypothetical protein
MNMHSTSIIPGLAGPSSNPTAAGCSTPWRSEAVGYGPDNQVAITNTAADGPFVRGVEILLSDSRGEIASR